MTDIASVSAGRKRALAMPSTLTLPVSLAGTAGRRGMGELVVQAAMAAATRIAASIRNGKLRTVNGPSD